MTMLCVTHEMGFARTVANRVIFMDRGEIIEQNAPEEFFNNPQLGAHQAVPQPDPASLTGGTATELSMRHATDAALDQLEDMLRAVRKNHPILRERKRGAFYKGGQRWLHFHEDPAGLPISSTRMAGCEIAQVGHSAG